MYRWGCLALTGCAQLAGIDSTTKAPDAAPPTLNTLQLEHISIGKTTVRAPQLGLAMASVPAAFLVPDAAAPGGIAKVTATATVDSWLVDAGATPHPVLFESPNLPTPSLLLIDLPNTTIKFPVMVLERVQTPDPAPAMATIDINVGLNTIQGNESYQLFTIGAWANVGVAAPAAMTTQLNPAPLMLTVNNSPIRRLDKITTADSVLLLRYSGNQLVAHLEAPGFDQTMANTITGNFTATPQNQTLDINVNQMQAAQRLSTVLPAVGAPSYVWRVRAAPGFDLGLDAGPSLDAASVAAPIAADPQKITATYGNPFAANFKTLLSWSIGANRTYTNGALSVGLAAGFSQRVAPAAGMTLAQPAGLPDRITANGTVLNIDNKMITAPMTAPVEISFTTDAATNTLYVTELFELVPNMAGTAYTLTRVVATLTAMPRIAIPRDMFKTGSLYVIRASSAQGCYTAVATGDLTQQSLPCATAFADSGVFQVAP